MVSKKDEELWITNISREKDVALNDLRLTIRRGQSINLLAKKKNGQPVYNFSRKQIDASILSGSIFKKGIKVRKVAPVVFNTRIDVEETLDRALTRLKRKPTEIEVPDYPDLDFDEGSIEDFAAENADMDFADRQPIIAVDPKFKKKADDE